MSHLPGVEPRHVNRRTTLCRNPRDRARWIANEENDSVLAPTPAYSHDHSRQCADQTTIEIEPLEKPVRIKRNGTAVRRPEGRVSTAGPGERACCHRVDCT